METRQPVSPWLALAVALMLPASGALASAGQAQAGVERKLKQKIQMVDHLLNSRELLQRIDDSGDDVARQLLARAAKNFRDGEAYFARGQYLEAEAIIDYVLRDLSASSQLTNVLQLSKNKYRQFVGQLDAFALPDWKHLNAEETRLLQTRLAQVNSLRTRAVVLADAGSYDDAIALLEQAYGIKAGLLEELGHENVVIYELSFATQRDEYRYLLDRTYHFLEMVHLALETRQPDEATQKLVDDLIYRSMLSLDQAEQHEIDNSFGDAIPVLENTIERLSSALKVLGIGI